MDFCFGTDQNGGRAAKKSRSVKSFARKLSAADRQKFHERFAQRQRQRGDKKKDRPH